MPGIKTAKVAPWRVNRVQNTDENPSDANQRAST
jgi:hypothetical protein